MRITTVEDVKAAAMCSYEHMRASSFLMDDMHRVGCRHIDLVALHELLFEVRKLARECQAKLREFSDE